MKTKVLELLRGTEGYVSGQDICDALGVSRTAVWKVIGKLKEEGYDIEAVKNKGYRIVTTPDILSKSEIECLLDIPYNVIYFDDIDSTNNYAKLIAEKGESDKTIVIADHQTMGKGRRGRSFDSPSGVGAFMTFLLRPDISPVKASMLTIIAAMAVRDSVDDVTGLKCKIKWPNDIISDGKKICGILTEMSAEIEHVNYVVVGIGVNINNESFAEEIKDVATSIKIELKKIADKTSNNASDKTSNDAFTAQINRNKLVAKIVERFDYYYEKFLQNLDLSAIKDEYNSHLINRDAEVFVLKGDESYKAIAKGIDDTGELIVEKDGQLVKVMSGEVSVRGVYGYV